MARSKAFVIAAGVALASGGLAGAADLPPAPRLPPPAPVVEDFSGWYLRGDVGLGVAAARPNLQNEPDPISTGVSSGFLSTYASSFFNNTTLSPSGMFDFGVGYRFNNWVRMDGTLEYRAAPGRSCSTPSPTRPRPSSAARCSMRISSMPMFRRSWVSSTATSTSGTTGASRPSSARVGFADNMLSGFTDQGFRLRVLRLAGFFRQLFGQRLENKLRLALMAGLDFDVTRNLRLELGYRYLNYGSIKSGASYCLAGAGGGVFTTANCTGGVPNYISSRNQLASNDLRIGLIWLLGAPPPAPAPIVTRY